MAESVSMFTFCIAINRFLTSKCPFLKVVFWSHENLQNRGTKSISN